MSERNAYVTDTHALIWHLTSSHRLSAEARHHFERADRGLSKIYIPLICLVEAVYLAERKQIPDNLFDELFDKLVRSATNYEVVDLELIITRMLRRVEREAVPEMPDRIIVTTAAYLELPLITKDEKIKSARVVPTIW